jgi:hypothetical protein
MLGDSFGDSLPDNTLDPIEAEVFGEWHDGSQSDHLVAIMVEEMPGFTPER